MKKAGLIFCIFLLSFSTHFIMPTLIANETKYPSIVDHVPWSGVEYSLQRKTFYANTRHWVFYSDGAYMVYKTSTDGSSWSNATKVAECSQSSFFDIFFDGVYLHYARLNGTLDTDQHIFYRRGIPNSEGTITWSEDEQYVAGAKNRFPTIAVDSSGYPYIGYRNDTSFSDYKPYVIKSSTNNGKWSTASGYPYLLKDSVGIYNWQVRVIPLTNQRVYVIYQKEIWITYGRLYDGSWGDEETVNTLPLEQSSSFSATSINDDVYFAFLERSSHDIHALKRTYGSGWSKVEDVALAQDFRSYPSLSSDTINNRIYCFWEANDHVYYKRRLNEKWCSSALDWFTIDGILGHKMTTYYKFLGNKCGLMIQTLNTLYYDYIPPNRNPTIGSFEAPSTIYAHQTVMLNTTVNDVDGRDDLKNVTLCLSGSIKLNWFENDNSTTMIDPSNYAELVSSQISVVNATAYKITWQIRFYGNYSEGYVDLETKAFDKLEAFGLASQDNWFYFKVNPPDSSFYWYILIVIVISLSAFIYLLKIRSKISKKDKIR